MKTEVFGALLEIDDSKLEDQKAEIKRQLSEYFKGERKAFKTGIYFPDSFTGEVMREISDVGYGETITYGEIAKRLDSSPIAVGQACGKNPVPIIVPCHRVTGKNSLGGYIIGGEVKKKLLELENKQA